MQGSHKRTIIKTITFRVFAFLATTLIVYVFTGRIVISVGVAIVESIIKTILYYFHERIWDGIAWGKPKHPLDDIVFDKDKALKPDDKEKIRKQLQELGYLE